MIKILREYTDISEKFIKDFFGNFNPEMSDDDEFMFKDSRVAKWLGIQLLTLRRRLLETYRTNKNSEPLYYEFADFVRRRNGKNINYYITYECFEHLSMLSQTKKGIEVRGYFVKLRQFIQENKTTIYQALNNRDELKKINNNATNKGKEFIYAIAVDERHEDMFNANDNKLKLGRTIDIIKRLQTYNVGRIQEVDLKFLAVIDDSYSVEKCMKINLDKYRIFKNKEIFKISVSILKKILNLCKCENSNLCQMIKYLEDKVNIKPYLIIN